MNTRELVKRKQRLLQLMLFLNTFSAADLKAAVKNSREPVSNQTIHNLLSELKANKLTEVVETEPSGRGRPRERYRVTLDPGKRQRFYERAYGKERDDYPAPERVQGESFTKALQLRDKAKVKMVVLSPKDRESIAGDLAQALEYLEIAFYEQTPTARQGPVGSRILMARDEIKKQKLGAHSRPRRSWTELVGVNLTDSMTSIGVLLKTYLPDKHKLSDNLMKWAEGLTSPPSATVLEAVRYALSLVAREVTQKAVLTKLQKLYYDFDQGASVESLYNRACFSLLCRDNDSVRNTWEKLDNVREHQLYSTTIEDLVKTYFGKVSGSGTPYRVAKVDTAQLYEEWRALKKEDCNLDAVSMNRQALSQATGRSIAVTVSGSVPPILGLPNSSVEEFPLPDSSHSSGSLYVTEGVAKRFAVAGPVPMKLAVALDKVGIESDCALETSIEICEGHNKYSLIFVSGHDVMDKDWVEKLPDHRRFDWLPLRAARTPQLVSS